MATVRTGGLGRGLQALLGSHNTLASQPGSPTVLALSQLVPGVYQPRTHMDGAALQDLAESIKLQGIMQPILVRRLDTASATAKHAAYEIIAGERRFRAAKLAGLDHVPVLVRDVPNEAAAAMALIENIQREDLNPLEEAQGLQRLIVEFGLTHETAARAVGRSRSATSNLLRLLNLAESVQAMLIAGDIDMGHARALLILDRGMQVKAATLIVAKKMSVRQAEALVRKLAVELSPTPSPTAAEEAHATSYLERVQAELTDLLMASVEIRLCTTGKQRNHGTTGRAAEASGELAIRFGSLDALRGLIDRLRRPAAASN